MITCYLDSQDYSTLTDPKLDNLERRQIKEDLLHLSRSRQVRFAFSAAVVCESVALTVDAAHLAELKAELLGELCGSNALVSFDRLIGAEIDALSRRSTPPRDIFDQRGRWFPDILIDETPMQLWEKMRELAEEEMKVMGLSRQERRVKARALIKNGKPRQILISQLTQQDQKNVFIVELMKKYPMRPESAEVMGLYMLGQATEKDFSEALMNSLTDPRWMMKWFTTQHALSSPIADMVRKPGRELGQAMRSLAEISAQWATELREAGLDTDPTGKRGEIALRWQEMEERQIIAITRRMASAMGFGLGDFEGRDVKRCCLGISAGVRSLYSSVWANVGEGRIEEISDSQPVDALHAFYAPYVKVFRADRFMAPHIQKQVRSAGTIVVSRLSQLVETLEKQIR
ncbi:hypothetical protein [Pulveribacter suum]|uniref:hypothetical protein n=1 Tax=Pulveribacter suum TaxID=2116657 RepID=UPI0013004348|nr:hypothetical protein [Pulveribacter suum]